jgi:hypothetical protein
MPHAAAAAVLLDQQRAAPRKLICDGEEEEHHEPRAGRRQVQRPSFITRRGPRCWLIPNARTLATSHGPYPQTLGVIEHKRDTAQTTGTSSNHSANASCIIKNR